MNQFESTPEGEEENKETQKNIKKNNEKIQENNEKIQENNEKIKQSKITQKEEAKKIIKKIQENTTERDTIEQIGKVIGIEGVTTREALLNNPQLDEKIMKMFKEHEQNEVEKGNTRNIDKYLWDPINERIDTKKKIYDFFDKDKIVSPKTMKPKQKIKPIDNEYFEFDEKNTKNIQELNEMKKNSPNIKIDKEIPKNIQYAIFKAYERYPELKGKSIHFEGMVDGFTVMPDKQHVMRAQRKYASAIKELVGMAKKEDRKYRIQVNLLEKEGIVTLPKVNQLSKGGVLSHEFYHILHYSTMTPSKFIKFGAGFAGSPNRVREMERRTDLGSIARGTGHGLSEFRKGVHAGSSEEYTKYKKRTYLDEKEILYAILMNKDAYSDEMIEETIQKISRTEKTEKH